MKQINNVAVIGLGSMGMGAAKSCVKAGLNVYGGDLNTKALKELQDFGAKVCETSLIPYAKEIDALLILVVNAQQVKQVLFGGSPCLAESLNKGTAVMVSSTISAKDSKEINEKLESLGLLMLDAPVSGGAAKANIGEITVMAAGKQEAFDVLKPMLDAIADKVYNIGEEIGLGATVKIIHQLLAGVHIAAGAEAMAMACKAGIPLDVMYDVVTHAAGNSWMFENRMKHVVDGDFTPLSAVDIFVKDLNLVSDTAKELHFPTPLASTALTMFTNASNAGFGKLDDSAVIKSFMGIKLPSDK